MTYPNGVKSLTAGGEDRAAEVVKLGLQSFSDNFSQKLAWFLSCGYRPHAYQTVFHAAELNGRLRRFRHLVAGRRGGKTLSAAWEVIAYCIYPQVFHRDAHGVDSNRPLWVWVLAKDHEVGRPARMAIQQVLDAAGLQKDKDYKWNKTEKTIEFLESGTFLQFRTADDPQSLRGAGLDILWIDEAAMIPNADAWVTSRPALSDKIGLAITTTTPMGKNWLWEEFFQGEALTDERQFRVEYTSIDNPYFAREEWEYAQAHMHPMHFKREYMAAFDAMAGRALQGDWLHFYTMGKPDNPGDVEIPKDADGRTRLRRYIGVDPSTGESEDSFAIACLGIAHDYSMAFLIDYYLGKIPFPDQIDKIREWHLKYRPELIGVESNAYQRALVQMSNRLAGMPGMVPVISRGKKSDRIMSMSPLFKIGKARIHASHTDFIDQWVSYDPARRDNRDDLLDAVEIALSVGGVLLPSMAQDLWRPPEEKTIHQQAIEQIMRSKDTRPIDPEMGSSEYW